MADKRTLCRGIAEAFLAGPWSVTDMAERGELLLGERPRWLVPLARRVRAKFPTAPPGTRHALVAFIAEDPAFSLAYAQSRRRLGIETYVLRDPVMVPHRGAPETFRVPEITTEHELADFLGVAPARLAAYARASHGGLARTARAPHYVSRWVAKPSGGVRLLEAPRPRLRAMQRAILHGVLDAVPPHAAAHGFCRGRSVRTFAAPHAGRAIVLRVDLRDFFASVRASRVHALFAALGYPEQIARLLTGLCTLETTPAVFASAPPVSTEAEVSARAHTFATLRAPHLPQGAPSSPALANLCAFGLDARLSAAAQAAGAAYTRYADDLLFSGGDDFARQARRFYALVCGIAADEGFAVQGRKTRFMRAAARQHAAGLVLNARPTLARREYQTLEAILHNCARTGPAAQNREGHRDFRAHLRGRVAWVESLDPARGARLRARFDAIAWESCTIVDGLP